MYKIPSEHVKIGHVYRVVSSCTERKHFKNILNWINRITIREPIREHLREHVIARKFKLGLIKFRAEGRRRKFNEEHRNTSNQ